MKKITYSIFTVLMLVLTACSGNSSNAQQQQFNNSQSTNASPNELPLASKLVIGSFKLEGTGNAITAEQAAQLLPLWQVYDQLTTSDTAAQEEVTSLAEQIQETMTVAQMTAINAMNLTPQDIFTTMQDQGIQFNNNRQQSSQVTNGQSNNGNFERSQGGGGRFFFGSGGVGGPGGDGGSSRFNGGGQGLSPEQIATAQARRAQNGGGGSFGFNSTPAPLIQALVKLLQQRAGS